jgi:hypothetical protein
MSSSMEKVPQVGSKAVKLAVNVGALRIKETFADDLRELYQQGLCTDVSLVCAEQNFRAHKAALAARSPVFRDAFADGAADDGAAESREIRITDAANPEAVKFMLDYIYEADAFAIGGSDYNPGVQDINTDVLRLARAFQLPGLTMRAMHWLAKDITAGDVIERLAICNEFGLEVLKGKVLESLHANRAALADVVNSPKIIQYPELMQLLLQQAASCGKGKEEDDEPAKKKAKTAPVKGKGKIGAKGGR